MLLQVYGCRGSAAVSHTGASKYGGNSSCFRLKSKNRSLILDAGSGLLLIEAPPAPVNILLSHLHLDHTVGLSTFPPVWDQHGGVRIFTRDRTRADLKRQVFGAFKKPYWPVETDLISSAEVTAISVGAPFSPDGVFTVTSFEASHPDGTDSFKITDGDKTIIYMLDYEIAALTEEAYSILVKQCESADLIICDTTYHPDDYPAKRGWGHSCVPHGVKLADDCGCGKMLFSHYSFDYSDEDLDKWPKLLDQAARKERFIFARDGMEVEI